MKYSRSIDFLVPAIFYLGTNEGWWARSANNMARELSLNEAKLLTVLDGFPSIFRKSLTTDPDHSGHYYSLQARYALRYGSELGEAERAIDVPPLSREQLKMVLDFVQQSAESERLTARALLTGSISSFAALVAAAAAIAVALMKPAAATPTPCVVSGASMGTAMSSPPTADRPTRARNSADGSTTRLIMCRLVCFEDHGRPTLSCLTIPSAGTFGSIIVRPKLRPE